MEKLELEPIQIVLVIRHAHRDTQKGVEVDNGLSEKGLIQAKKIKEYVELKFGNQKPFIISSPKKRCIETVEPIASKNNLEIKISQLLDEGGDVEGKVEQFISQVKTSKESLLIICSHGDIIPSLLEKMVHVSVEVSKGGMVRIEKNGKRYSFQGLLEDFDLK